MLNIQAQVGVDKIEKLKMLVLYLHKYLIADLTLIYKCKLTVKVTSQVVTQVGKLLSISCICFNSLVKLWAFQGEKRNSVLMQIQETLPGLMVSSHTVNFARLA